MCPQTKFNLQVLSVLAPQQFRSSIKLPNCLLDRVHNKRQATLKFLGCWFPDRAAAPSYRQPVVPPKSESGSRARDSFITISFLNDNRSSTLRIHRLCRSQAPQLYSSPDYEVCLIPQYSHLCIVHYVDRKSVKTRRIPELVSTSYDILLGASLLVN